MRKRRIGAGVAAVVIAAGLGGLACAWQPAIAPVKGDDAGGRGSAARFETDPAVLAAGLRVMSQGDCLYCHTAKGGKPYAGGLPMDTPFGTIRSTNITPDVNTGIGAWSLDAFTRAMREGVSRDGHLLYPAFPYVHFTRMRDEDIAAAYSYLMSRTPVDAPPLPNAMVFPLNFRPLVAGWNLLFLDKGPLPAAPASALPAVSADGSASVSASAASGASSEWQLGRYLVEGAGHCQACHTPMNVVGAEARGHAFQGGVIDGWQAPALNALAAGERPWTKAQLVSYLRTGVASEHGAASGPMRPVTQHLAEAPESDVAAMATYLLSLSGPANDVSPAGRQGNDPAPVSNPAPVNNPAPVSDPALVRDPVLVNTARLRAASGPEQERVSRGAVLFASTCAGCHGAAAPMMTIGGRPSLADSSNVLAGTPRNALRMILEGNPWQGSTSAHYMPSYADLLTDDQIVDVAAYLRVQVAGRPAWTDASSMLTTMRKENEKK